MGRTWFALAARPLPWLVARRAAAAVAIADGALPSRGMLPVAWEPGAGVCYSGWRIACPGAVFAAWDGGWWVGRGGMRGWRGLAGGVVLESG